MISARTFTVAMVIAVGACSANEDTPAASDSVDAGNSDATSPDAAPVDAGAPSDTGGDPTAERSGARIKLTFETTGDGFRTRVGLYDSQLDTECVPSLTDDGATHCLPQAAATANLFRDSGCKQRVASLSACLPKPKYAWGSSESGSCGPFKQRVFALGAQLTPTTVYVDGANGCQPATPPSADTYYDVTEVPATTFAMLDATTHPLVPGLEAIAFETADGLRMLSQLRVAHGGAPCRFSNAADNRLRCLPQIGVAGIVGSLFSDGNCQNAVAFLNCPNYSVAARYVGGCPGRLELYSVGAPLAADAGAFRQSGTGCTPGGGSNLRPVTGPIAPSEFVLGTPVPSSSSARLRIDPIEVAPNIRLSSGPIAMSLPIHDTAKGVDCLPQPAADGKMRCLPSPSAYAEVFADDQCTTRLARVLAPSCGVPKFALQFSGSASSCVTTGVRVYPLGTKRSTTVTYARDDSTNGKCLLQGVAEGADIYDLGPEIAPTEFAEVMTTHD